nr:putative reverse transcriptase domain-containing protein [Tanacetum cinerariifolium]
MKILEFSVGDHVMMKVSPWKGVVHFGKKCELAPRSLVIIEQNIFLFSVGSEDLRQNKIGYKVLMVDSITFDQEMVNILVSREAYDKVFNHLDTLHAPFERKTDDERTYTNVEDQVNGVAEMNIAEEAEEEIIERVKEPKTDEELKADEEQKGDDQARDEQVVKEPFHAVKVSVIPKTTQIQPTTPPAPSHPAIKIPYTQVSNSKVVKFVVQIFNKLEKAVKELKQADQSATMLTLIKSQLPSVVNDYLGSSLLDAFKQEALEKTPPSLATTNGGDNPDKVLKKRDNGDDQDKDPSARSNQGKSSARTSKSGKSMTANESVEEPVFEIASGNVKRTFDDKNTVKTIDDTPKQSWFNEMVQAEKPPLTFDELLSNPIDFSAFAMNRLRLNKIKREVLVDPVLNLPKGTYRNCVELEYNIEECYATLTDQLDWINRKGHKSPIDMSKPLPMQDKEGRLTILVDFFFNNDLEYLKAGNKERAVEDMQLGVESYHISVKEPYTSGYDPLGIIYEDKSKKKRLMHVDEIHKFCDGTLRSVCKIIREMLLNFKFEEVDMKG